MSVLKSLSVLHPAASIARQMNELGVGLVVYRVLQYDTQVKVKVHVEKCSYIKVKSVRLTVLRLRVTVLHFLVICACVCVCMCGAMGFW